MKKPIGRIRIGETLKKGNIILLIVIMMIGFSMINPVYISTANLINIVKQVAINGILALGVSVVIISGGMNLSVGGTIALTCVIASKFALTANPYPIILPFLVAIGVGALCGVVNGIGITYGNIPAFIMTMSIGISTRGLALLITHGIAIFGLTKEFGQVANGFTLHLPNLIYYLAGVLIVIFVLMRCTVFGKRVYAVGGNAKAARLSGIHVGRTVITVYTLSGAIAGLCGVLMAMRIMSGNATVAEGYDLNAVASCVIGGVSIGGGVGSVLGAIGGALIMGMLNNGFDIIGVSPYYQDIMQGLIIIIAVYLDSVTKRKATWGKVLKRDIGNIKRRNTDK